MAGSTHTHNLQAAPLVPREDTPRVAAQGKQQLVYHSHGSPAPPPALSVLATYTYTASAARQPAA